MVARVVEGAHRARSLMVLGTASHVGKSIVTAGLGRILADDGYRVAPFKAQNMSLNSAVTPDGLEIGRAQALQAEACRIAARVEMNPILIKPSSDTGAQIVVLGRIWGHLTARDFHQGRVEEVASVVLESYARLATDHDVIVIEGAGSPAEINLKHHDIVNMRMAIAADAACLLVADIDRGGAFASLLGTLELLPDNERALIRGFIINKFRGDISLLKSGIEVFEQRIQLPCLGVIPYLHNLDLDEEDGVSLDSRRSGSRVWSESQSEESHGRRLKIGVIAFPHLSNFTDFDALAMEPSVAVAFLQQPSEIAAADVVILPGTKQTIDDLEWLKRTGLALALAEFRKKANRGIIGICGGMQMLGQSITDPSGTESGGSPRMMSCLGMLPVNTVLQSEKTTRRIEGCVTTPLLWGSPLPVTRFDGYEIHVGETLCDTDSYFSMILASGDSMPHPDGAISSDGLVVGTYVHGLFDNDSFRHAFISAARASCGLTQPVECLSVTADRDRRIDRLAAHLRHSLNVPLIESWLQSAGS
jgi:adenosylcobyric acid synthase